MARKIRSISLNPKMLADIDRGCAFRGWTFSRWLEEAAKFQIMADRKAMRAEATKEIKPKDINFSKLSEEDFEDWHKAMIEAMIHRKQEKDLEETMRIVKENWIEESEK